MSAWDLENDDALRRSHEQLDLDCTEVMSIDPAEGVGANGFGDCDSGRFSGGGAGATQRSMVQEEVVCAGEEGYD